MNTYSSSVVMEFKVAFKFSFLDRFAKRFCFAQMVLIQFLFKRIVCGFWKHAFLFQDGHNTKRLKYRKTNIDLFVIIISFIFTSKSFEWVTFSISSMQAAKSIPKSMKTQSMPSFLYSSCSSTNMWWLKNCCSFSLVKLMQSCSKLLN